MGKTKRTAPKKKAAAKKTAKKGTPGRALAEDTVRFGEKDDAVRVLANRALNVEGARTNRWRFRIFHYKARKMTSHKFMTRAAAVEYGRRLHQALKKVKKGKLVEHFEHVARYAGRAR